MCKCWFSPGLLSVQTCKVQPRGNPDGGISSVFIPGREFGWGPFQIAFPLFRAVLAKYPFTLHMPALFPLSFFPSYFWTYAFENSLLQWNFTMINSDYVFCLPFKPFSSDQYECTVSGAHTVLTSTSFVWVYIVLLYSQLLFIFFFPLWRKGQTN